MVENFAPLYSTLTLPVPAGTYCTHNGVLYRANTTIASGETWTQGHWTKVDVGGEVSDLKSAVNAIGTSTTKDTPAHWVSGGLNQSMTSTTDNANRAHIAGSYLERLPSDGVVSIEIPSTLLCRVAVYTEQRFATVVERITGYSGAESTRKSGSVKIPPEYNGLYLGMDCKKADDTDFTEEEIAALSSQIVIKTTTLIGELSNLITDDKSSVVGAINENKSAIDYIDGKIDDLQVETDKDLILENVPADAKAVCDRIGNIDILEDICIKRVEPYTEYTSGGLNGNTYDPSASNKRIRTKAGKLVKLKCGDSIVIGGGFESKVIIANANGYGSRVIAEMNDGDWMTGSITISDEYEDKYFGLLLRSASDPDADISELVDTVPQYVKIYTGTKRLDEVVDELDGRVEDLEGQTPADSSSLFYRNKSNFTNHGFFPYKYYPTDYHSEFIFDIPLDLTGNHATSGMCGDGVRYLWISTKTNEYHNIIYKYDIMTNEIVQQHSYDYSSSAVDPVTGHNDSGLGHAQSMTYKDGEIYVVSYIGGTTPDTVFYADGGTKDRMTVLDADTLEIKRCFGYEPMLRDTDYYPRLQAIAWSDTFKCFAGVTPYSSSSEYSKRGLLLFTEDGIIRARDILSEHSVVCDGIAVDNSYICPIFSYHMAFYRWDDLTQVGFNGLNKLLKEQETLIGHSLESESVISFSDCYYVNANVQDVSQTELGCMKLFKVTPKTFAFVTE